MRCYVSYAWADEGDPNREAQVDALVEQARRQGIEIIRDKDTLKPGDRISAFMQKIGGGDRVFVFLSDKYLKSLFCMNELLQIWKYNRESPEEFLKRVRFFTLGNARFNQISDRIGYAEYWRNESDKVGEILKGKSASLLSEADYGSFRLMNEFAVNIGEILALFADVVRPGTFEEFLKYGFRDPNQGQRTDGATSDALPDTRLQKETVSSAAPEALETSPSQPAPPAGPQSLATASKLNRFGLASVAGVVLAAVVAAVVWNFWPPAPDGRKPDHADHGEADRLAWCYQEHQKDGYFVACHQLKDNCIKARGVNNPIPGTDCAPVDLSKVVWKSTPGGYLGSQYSKRDTPFPAPFPQMDETASTPGNPGGKQLTVYTQIGSEADRGKFKALKSTLLTGDYLIPAAQVMNTSIDRNDVRYCNPLNAQDAKALAAFIQSKGFNAPTVTKITKCDPSKTLNNLEVWLQSGGS